MLERRERSMEALFNRCRRRRIRFTSADRLPWAGLSRAWPKWRSALVVVKRRPSSRGTGAPFVSTGPGSRWRTGRPGVPSDVRALIQELSTANPLWVRRESTANCKSRDLRCQSTVARYMRRHPRPPLQTWRTFFTDHASQIMAADLFVVPTVTFACCSFWIL